MAHATAAPVRARPAASGRNDNTAFLPGESSPREWIESLPTARRVEDGLRLMDLFDDITGEPAVLWAGSIVGYGHHHYVYDSGREGDTFIVGFSPRASTSTLYGLLGTPDEERHLSRLGPHKTGKGCLYLSRVDRVDREVLREMVATAWRLRDAG